MAGGLVNIILKSISRGSGWKEQVDNAKELRQQVGDLSQATKKFGTIFGAIGGVAGSAIANILKGGIWQAAADGVRLLYDWVGKLWNKIEEADKELAAAQQRVVDAQVKQLNVLADVHRKAAEERRKAIDEATKQYTAELDAVHNLTRATLELERARARKRGDNAGAVALDEQIAHEDAANARAKLERALLDAESRKKESAKNYNQAVERGNEAKKLKESLQYDLTAETNAEVRKNLRKNIARSIIFGEKSDADAAKEKANYDKAVAEIANARKALAAFDIREQAKLENAEAEAREKEAEEVKKFEAEKKRLEKSIADEQRKLQLEAAKERERLDREAHQKRMEDLRKEIAAQKESASVLTSRASAAQSEFDKAFAMYRDPSRAAAEIGEEKDYQNDLDRLHRDARRYGGKWRIDELSRLMSAGDTQGVTDTLKDWRKSRNFTPEVEAMVRASAAENAKTSTLDELRKIEAHTAGLDKKLDELLSMKGGS